MQRNLALRWLRETFNANSSQAGIVYFADDDNTYSLELFEEVSADVQLILLFGIHADIWVQKPFYISSPNEILFVGKLTRS